MAKQVTQLGFWSAVLATFFSLSFTAGATLGIVGVLRPPWDVIIGEGASLLLAPTFVVMMVCVHYVAPEQRKLWSHVGLSFALLYAALASIVYVVWLFVVEPKVASGQPEKAAPFLFEPGSFMQMVDGLAYTYMGVATLFAAPVFSGTGKLERWVRRLCLINGALSVLVFLSYIFYSVILGIWWSISFPALALVLAAHFRQVQQQTQ